MTYCGNINQKKGTIWVLIPANVDFRAKKLWEQRGTLNVYASNKSCKIYEAKTYRLDKENKQMQL